MRGDGRGQRAQAPPSPRRGNQDAHVGQDAFPFGICAAGHGRGLFLFGVHDGESMFEPLEANFIDVIRRAQAFQRDRFGVALRNREFFGGLLERQIVCEE
ncbi:hypothetical protein D3C73_1172300 [compost metagenome]